MMYNEVRPDLFEKCLKVVNQKSLQQNRDYTSKRCFLDEDFRSGFALTSSGTLCHVFSTVKGRGVLAVKAAINLGANSLSCYNYDLVKYYRDFGFFVAIAEKTNQGFIKYWMCRK